MSDSSKERKKKFTDMVSKQKSEDQQGSSKHTDDFNENLNMLEERAAQLE